MIHEFHVQNYKALRDVKLKLTPMHVLIGPNDSGKTSILEALGALCRSVEMELPGAFFGKWNTRELVFHGAAEAQVKLSISARRGKSHLFDYSLAISFSTHQRDVTLYVEQIKYSPEPSQSVMLRPERSYSEVQRLLRMPDGRTQPHGIAAFAIADAISPMQSFRWNLRMLALPVVPNRKREFQLERSGFGLAQLLDDILSRNPQRFLDMQKRFCDIFTNVAAIQLDRTDAFSVSYNRELDTEGLTSGEGKGIYFVLKPFNQRVSAFQVSDGMLLVLAYLALLYSPDPPRMLLIEEPENGIHPSLLKEVTVILRELVGEHENTQIIMTTHSPYMVDMFKPDEVTLCVKDDQGDVKTRCLDDSPIVLRQMKTFTLGEIWTSEEDVVKAEALNGGVPVEQ